MKVKLHGELRPNSWFKCKVVLLVFKVASDSCLTTSRNEFKQNFSKILLLPFLFLF